MRLVPALGGDLSAVVVKALEKSPERRYASAALAADLRAVLDRRPVAARRPTPVSRFVHWVHRSPALATFLLCMGVAVTIIAALTGYLVARRPLIEAALRSERQDAYDRLVAKAWLDLYDGQLERGIGQFEQVLRLQPESIEARHGIAHALGTARRFDEALRVLGPDAGADAPDHALRRLRCTLPERSGRGEAAKALEKSLPPPVSPMELFVVGSRELEQGRRQEDRKRILGGRGAGGRRRHGRLGGRVPERPRTGPAARPAVLRGLALLKSGNAADAAVEFRRTVDESPEVATYQFYLGTALGHAGDRGSRCWPRPAPRPARWRRRG